MFSKFPLSDTDVVEVNVSNVERLTKDQAVKRAYKLTLDLKVGTVDVNLYNNEGKQK